jgi:hypothetical protein
LRRWVGLPNAAACENGLAEIVVLLPERRKRSQDVDLRLPKVGVGDLAVAERFQGLLDGGEARNRADLACRFRLTRARVYTAALSLPSVEPTEDAKPGRSPEPPSNWQGFDEFENYWEAFDRYKLDEAVAGSLSDDLLDVYRDVRRGLAFWESGHDASAIWEWRFSFESHWGDHAVMPFERFIEHAVEVIDEGLH